jgi:hypothetical protein
MRIYVTNNIVKQQLSKTERAFKFENSHGNFFQIHRGVRQWEFPKPHSF